MKAWIIFMKLKIFYTIEIIIKEQHYYEIKNHYSFPVVMEMTVMVIAFNGEIQQEKAPLRKKLFPSEAFFLLWS